MVSMPTKLSRSATLDGKTILAELARPWGVARLLWCSALLVAAATAYCVVYCAVAYQPLHGGRMPLIMSFAWAVGATLPWLLCFELCKPGRLPNGPTLARTASVAAAFAGASLLSIVLELGLDQLVGNEHTRPIYMQVAAQMPAALSTSLFLFVARALPVVTESAPQHDQPIDEIVRLSDRIRWIEAAGNYVEVHADDRTLLYRLTMRQLEQALEPRRFVRIHRSAIVNQAQIDAKVSARGSSAVRLKDGTLVKVGDRYACNLATALG